MNMQWFMVQIQLLFVFSDFYLCSERFERGLKEKYCWGKIDLIIEDMCLLKARILFSDKSDDCAIGFHAA